MFMTRRRDRRAAVAFLSFAAVLSWGSPVFAAAEEGHGVAPQEAAPSSAASARPAPEAPRAQSVAEGRKGSEEKLAEAARAPGTSTREAGGSTREAGLADTHYSYEAVLLVVMVLLLLVAMFYLLMYWSQRSERVSYLGTLYKETIEDIEYKRIAGVFAEKMKSGEYHREVTMDARWSSENVRPNPPAELPYETTDAPGLPYGVEGSRRPRGFNPFDDRVTDPEERQRLRDLQNKYNVDRDDWERRLEVEVRRRYEADLAAARQKARQQSELAIDVDLSALRGRGAEFVLEFTTVVVIIFAAVILGILKILDTQQIGTLLAAIAGYVLGRATQRARNEPVKSDKTEPVKEPKGGGGASVHPASP